MTVSPRIRFVSAGAGSGKTTTLARLLQEQLRGGQVRPEGVIATTFTKRAASDLRERVQQLLLREGEYSLARAMGSAQVGTVHGVCGTLLRRFAFEAGLSMEQRVLDADASSHLLRRSVDEVVEGEAMSELVEVARRLSLLDGVRSKGPSPWREALHSIVDAARCNGVRAASLCAFGPVNADRLLALLPPPAPADLDAVLEQAIESALPTLRNAAETGLRRNTRTYVEVVQRALHDLRAGTLAWSMWCKVEKSAPEAALAPVAAPIRAAAGEVNRNRRLHEDLRRYLTLVFDIAARVLDAYDRSKRAIGSIDHVDQEHLTLELLDHPVVNETMTDELDLLLVDEFQDTNPIQLALFLKLARHAKQVVWVGDVKQAIYGFRGSDPRLMQTVLDALPSLGATHEVLSTSWRSRPSLVGFVNDVFGDAFPGLARANVVLRPARPEYEGTPAVADWVLHGTQKAENWSALASGIGRLLADRLQILDRDTRSLRTIRLADIAVLASTNNAVTEIAAALRAAGIPSATTQPGLLSQPEVVLALACLRRLNDEQDTLATAEVVSLADCADPEAWLADRLAWLAGAGEPHAWCEAPRRGHVVHPIIDTLRLLRADSVVLSPREAVELVIERCGLVRRIIQWSSSADRARVRIANLDRMIDLVVRYEDEAMSSRNPATLAGLLVWLQDLSDSEADKLAQPSVDAVHVLTHHGAKGLEWPVVILCDLDADVRDRLWSVEAESVGAFDIDRPLHDRFVRYWPWPFGQQKAVPIADVIGRTAHGLAARADALDEAKRLLYVCMTRARDMLVMARRAGAEAGPRMQAVKLQERLPSGEPETFVVDGGVPVPFVRWELTGADATETVPSEEPAPSLTWWAEPGPRASLPPLRVSPSALSGFRATVVETVAVGAPIDTREAEDRARVGDAVHACLAACLGTLGHASTVGDVDRIVSGMGLAGAIDPKALHEQILAVRDWLQARWPDAQPQVELPVSRRRDNGQIVHGRADLVLRTTSGWVLVDHKSTPQSVGPWDAVAHRYAGQFAGYREVLETASGLPVEEIWLMLPVAGAAIRVEVEAEVVPVVPAASGSGAVTDVSGR